MIETHTAAAAAETIWRRYMSSRSSCSSITSAYQYQFCVGTIKEILQLYFTLILFSEYCCVRTSRLWHRSSLFQVGHLPFLPTQCCDNALCSFVSVCHKPVFCQNGKYIELVFGIEVTNTDPTSDLVSSFLHQPLDSRKTSWRPVLCKSHTLLSPSTVDVHGVIVLLLFFTCRDRVRRTWANFLLIHTMLLRNW